MSACPCGLKPEYEKCCKPFIVGKSKPQTAEDLLRSRYSAFVKKDINYIKSTHHKSTISDFDEKEITEWAENSEWMGLEVKRKEQGGESELSGNIEFVAKYKYKGETHVHHEISEFKKEDNDWYFVDADILQEPVKREGPKVGRNDPCPCGSGKKHKKCCL
jgi:SEC-C motif-containing protein